MKISIVVAYYNRKILFKRTLKSISMSKIKDIEVIAVDDGSSIEHRIESLVDEFSFLNVIRLNRENRWYTNPCVPYNIGIKAASGDIILLQNPESFHNGDILSYITDNLKENDYLSFSAYALTESQTNAFDNLNYKNIIEESRKIVLPYNPTVYYQLGIPGWYNHTIYRPIAYHFCSAMFKNKMQELNGFDERYAKGIAYDDDEFITRIRRNKMNVRIIDDLTVYHQYHDGISYQYPNVNELHERNRLLLTNITLKENTVYVDNNLIIR